MPHEEWQSVLSYLHGNKGFVNCQQLSSKIPRFFCSERIIPYITGHHIWQQMVLSGTVMPAVQNLLHHTFEVAVNQLLEAEGHRNSPYLVGQLSNQDTSFEYRKPHSIASITWAQHLKAEAIKIIPLIFRSPDLKYEKNKEKHGDLFPNHRVLLVRVSRFELEASWTPSAWVACPWVFIHQNGSYVPYK